jgi:hypothetical protein
MSGQSNEEPKKPYENRCAHCDLYIRQSETHGRCEFWKSMDVMPEWMEGEKIPSHAVAPDAGSGCEAFIPKDDGTGNSRQSWLLDNLTSLN